MKLFKNISNYLVDIILIQKNLSYLQIAKNYINY